MYTEKPLFMRRFRKASSSKKKNLCEEEITTVKAREVKPTVSTLLFFLLLLLRIDVKYGEDQKKKNYNCTAKHIEVHQKVSKFGHE